MRAIYFELLRRIEAARYDVFTEVIRVPQAGAGTAGDCRMVEGAALSASAPDAS